MCGRCNRGLGRAVFFYNKKVTIITNFGKVHPQEKYWRGIPIVTDTHIIITSTCITKWVYKDFGAPLIKILILSPEF